MSKYIIKKFEGRNSLFSIQSFYGAGEIFNEVVGKKLILGSGHYYKDGFCTWLGKEEDYIRAREWLIEKIDTNPEWGNNFYNKCYDDLVAFININNSVAWIDNLSGEDLIIASKDFIKKYTSIVAPAYFTDWYGYEADKWIRKFIDQSQLSDDQFRILSSGNEISFSKEYEYQLAKIKLAKSSYTVTDTHSRYYWIRDNYAHTGVLTIETIKKELNQLSIDEAIGVVNFVEVEQKMVAQEKLELLKLITLNKKQRGIIELLSKFVDLQDKRKAAVFVMNYIISRAFEKILDYKGITNLEDRTLILNSATHYWISDLSGEDLVKKAKLAYSGFLKTVYSDEIFGENANKNFIEMIGKVDERVKELKGYIASTGLAKGVVKIINKIDDFDKFVKGDVLVSSMTRPEMIPVMKLASAFVTDEGGITCHAAIIAREMNKPCIIGTKIATQVLKDGDLVEVDADNGVVRIIK